MLNCILCDYLGNVNSPVQISPLVEGTSETLAGVGIAILYCGLPPGYCGHFLAGYFCVSVNEVRLTSYSGSIKIYILSNICVLICIVDSCISRHLPDAGGQWDLDSVDLLAVMVLKSS